MVFIINKNKDSTITYIVSVLKAHQNEHCWIILSIELDIGRQDWIILDESSHGLLSVPTWLYVKRHPCTSLCSGVQGAAPLGGVGKENVLAEFFLEPMFTSGELSLSKLALRIFKILEKSICLPQNWCPIWEGRTEYTVLGLELPTRVVVGVARVSEGGTTVVEFAIMLDGEMIGGTTFVCFWGGWHLLPPPWFLFCLRARLGTTQRSLPNWKRK